MIIAAIDVDPQQCFTPICPDELPIFEGEQIGMELNKQASLSDYRVLTKDAHSPAALWLVKERKNMQQSTNLKNADLTWVSHAIPGTEGFEILKELPHFSDYDYVVWKGIEPSLHPYGACFHDLEENLSTGLIEWLESKSVDTVIIGGLALDLCVKITAIQLALTGKFKIYLNLASSRGTSQENNNDAIDEMKQHGIIVCFDYIELVTSLDLVKV